MKTSDFSCIVYTDCNMVAHNPGPTFTSNCILVQKQLYVCSWYAHNLCIALKSDNPLCFRHSYSSWKKLNREPQSLFLIIIHHPTELDFKTVNASSHVYVRTK